MSSVLYDVPGPKARARNRVLSIVGVAGLVALVVWAFLRIESTGQLAPEMWEIFQYEGVPDRIVDGMIATLQAFVLAGVLSLLLGALLAVARLSDHLPIRWLAVAFIELFRAVPLLITIFVIWAGFLTTEPMWALVLGLTLYNGAVQAEVLRAGILAVPRGQVEAAYAIGMRKSQVMLTIQIPQAVRSMLPTVVSQLVVTLKDTSLGYIIVYEELLYVGRQLAGNYLVNGDYPYVVVILVVGTIYVAMCMVLAWIAKWIEARGRRAKTGIKVAKAEPDVEADDALQTK
ncbi:amino acid ABC transporter permease [Streptomyces alkaliterrae]|uniref:ABC transporter permease subunit n=1 Tax=Streptomyces alkaliterrae TaxID=2213162 RepID=A0A5P0YP28_9ACTN|nr:amino acid ABC transporter permease [Streptomyces alkaliterrae]MBB1253030.1 amino acid ABC transporter permease [Streptomyces alkaliterrae]MBB1260295.1 amino acid ABC transporter permease [Streptomyces alkaliterrae]MQS01998.1 ABC transporter permease subunit [Streptomyces alkaliterrae]